MFAVLQVVAGGDLGAAAGLLVQLGLVHQGAGARHPAAARQAAAARVPAAARRGLRLHCHRHRGPGGQVRT